MAKPSVKTNKTPTKAPSDVRTAGKKGTISTADVRNAAAVRGQSFEFSGLPSLDLSGFTLPDGFVLLDSFNAVNQPVPDSPPSASSKFYIRSFATESPTTLQRVTYVFPVSPNEISINRVPISYTELPRPGRKPILKSVGRQLKQITATLMVVDGARTFLGSAQPQMAALESLSQIDADMNIFYPGIDPSAKWRMTDLSFRTMRRNTDNVVTLAEANVTFSEVVTLPTPVAGMPRIKDVPSSRQGSTNPGSSTTTQRGGDDDLIKAIIDAGPKPQNPGGTGFTVTTP